eukprot:SAG31_NODE_4622_length_3090_cov_1.329990_2_plen_82_part_00
MLVGLTPDGYRADGAQDLRVKGGRVVRRHGGSTQFAGKRAQELDVAAGEDHLQVRMRNRNIGEVSNHVCIHNHRDSSKIDA